MLLLPHTADISDMFLTISGWAGVTLDKLRQPFVRIRDPDNKTTLSPSGPGINNPTASKGRLLCQYHMGKHTKEKLAQYRSVIMARISRHANGGWVIVGIGKLGQGAAGEYEPLIAGCEEILAANPQVK